MLIHLSPRMPRRPDGRVAIVDELPRSPDLYVPFRTNDATLKTRLPLMVWNALGVAGEVDFKRRAKFARELVFIHLYGRYDFEMMRECEEGFFYRPPLAKSDHGLVLKSEVRRYSKIRPLFEIKPESKWRRMLGESTEELVLAMPELMHKHLTQVAAEIPRTPSRALRQIIVNELFGRRYSPELRGRNKR